MFKIVARLTVKADKIDEFKKTAEELVRKSSEEEENFKGAVARKSNVRQLFCKKNAREAGNFAGSV